MLGRSTFDDVPSRNEHGVPYRELLAMEKRDGAATVARMRQALELWLTAYAMEPGSTDRVKAVKKATALTHFLLS